MCPWVGTYYFVVLLSSTTLFNWWQPQIYHFIIIWLCTRGYDQTMSYPAIPRNVLHEMLCRKWRSNPCRNELSGVRGVTCIFPSVMGGVLVTVWGGLGSSALTGTIGPPSPTYEVLRYVLHECIHITVRGTAMVSPPCVHDRASRWRHEYPCHLTESSSDAPKKTCPWVWRRLGSWHHKMEVSAIFAMTRKRPWLLAPRSGV